MNTTSKSLLKALQDDYTRLTESKSDSPFGFSSNIGNENGTIYARKMVITEYFCLANLSFSEECCGQGVLTAFIEFIKKNPYAYKGISVELIHNPRLAAKLRAEGFELIPMDPISDEHAPSLVYLLS